jgi:hypothetical protein
VDLTYDLCHRLIVNLHTSPNDGALFRHHETIVHARLKRKIEDYIKAYSESESTNSAERYFLWNASDKLSKQN